MKETKYYIKYKKMYLNSIFTSEYFPNNEFIEKVVFTISKFYSLIWNYKQATFLIDKLVELGYVLDNFELEEVELEEVENED